MARIDEHLAPLRVAVIALALLVPACLAAAADETESTPTEQDFLGDMPVVLSVSRLAQPLPEAPARSP